MDINYIKQNTLHYHFNDYIQMQDELIRNRNEDYRTIISDGMNVPSRIASTVKGAKDMIRTTHHLRNFFVEKNNNDYEFYYIDDNDVYSLGTGKFVTNPHIGTQSLTSVTTYNCNIKIYYKMPNNTRFNLEYNKSYNDKKSDCQITIIIEDKSGKELFKNCPYVSTLNESNRTKYITRIVTDRYKKSTLTSQEENENLQNEKFFMVPVQHGGKKRSKRKRVSRRKNRKSRGTKKSRKHAKTRKSRR